MTGINMSYYNDNIVDILVVRRAPIYLSVVPNNVYKYLNTLKRHLA